MKKIYLLFILFLIVISLGCEKEKSDAHKFKEEYESLNEKENASGKKYRNIAINDENPFVYSNAKEIVDKINNKETFYVYFGDTMCPWCRSVIEKAIETVKDYDIDKIYYVKIWDDEHNEILRDVYKLTEDGKAVKDKEGEANYNKLLELLGNVLSEYTLTDSNGQKISTNEKRIYAPNFIYVKEGEAKLLVSGISSLQKDAYTELTKEMLDDEKQQFKKLFDASITCVEEGC